MILYPSSEMKVLLETQQLICGPSWFSAVLDWHPPPPPLPLGWLRLRCTFRPTLDRRLAWLSQTSSILEKWFTFWVTGNTETAIIQVVHILVNWCLRWSYSQGDSWWEPTNVSWQLVEMLGLGPKQIEALVHNDRWGQGHGRTGKKSQTLRDEQTYSY